MIVVLAVYCNWLDGISLMNHEYLAIDNIGC